MQVASKYKKEMKEVAEEYNLNLRKSEDKLEAAEEVIARIAEQGRSPSLIDKLIRLIRQFIPA